MQQLIVDEYQDLNPCDIQFVDELANRGVTTFVAGDDDQSIYSFRFASPDGIQSFSQRHPAAVRADLMDCFRCSVEIVAAANVLIQAYPIPNRIPKQLSSLHENAVPPEIGVLHRWSFERDIQEAQAVADSIGALVRDGVPPREILILVSNSRLQVPLLSQQLQARNIEHETPRQQNLVNEEVGRFALAILRIVCNTDDFIGHRTVLGSLQGVGAGTCNSIADCALAANVNYRDIFYHPLPAGVFRGRALRALERARAICTQLSGWRPDETVQGRGAQLFGLLTARYGQDADVWLTYTQDLPPGMTLEELRNYLWAENDEQRARILEAVYIRLHIQVPAGGFLPPKVRIMTMHGVKGLNATVVFIPGLEESIFPGDFRRPYAGLVFEAARLLYVSITRARAGCVLSFAQERIVYGRVHDQVASQFLAHLGGVFQMREVGLSAEEVDQIVRSRANLIPPP